MFKKKRPNHLLEHNLRYGEKIYIAEVKHDLTGLLSTIGGGLSYPKEILKLTECRFVAKLDRFNQGQMIIEDNEKEKRSVYPKIVHIEKKPTERFVERNNKKVIDDLIEYITKFSNSLVAKENITNLINEVLLNKKTK
jgi:hypothetical protein